MGNRVIKAAPAPAPLTVKMVPSKSLLESDIARSDILSLHTLGPLDETKWAANEVMTYLEGANEKKLDLKEIDTTSVNIELWWINSADLKFMKIATKYTFPQINKLQIKLLGHVEDDENRKCIEDMLLLSFNEPIKNLQLGGGHYWDLSKFKKSLRNILPLITEEVWLVSFKIDGSTLSKLFQYACNCKHLILWDCRIDMSTPFIADPSVPYQMNTLNLWGTVVKDNHLKLDVEKTSNFFSELGKTQLTETLTSVYVNNLEFWPDDLDFILTGSGFKAKTVGVDKYTNDEV